MIFVCLLKNNLRRVFLLGLVVLFFVSFLHFLVQTRIGATTITSNAFSASNYTVSETGVTYNLTFTTQSSLSSGGYFLGYFYGSDGQVANMNFGSATLATITDDDNDISGNVSLSSYLSGTGFRIDVTGETIALGSVIVLSVNGVTNPSAEQNYYPFIQDSAGNSTTTATVPKRPFGTSMLKVKVTEPDGVTTVSQAEIFIHKADYSMSSWQSADTTGQAAFFESDFWRPEGVSANGTYTIEVRAPTGSSYSDALSITGVSLTSGSTKDYTQAPLGHIALTRATLIGKVVVPNGCDTCIAVAGAGVPYANIDVRDSDSFDQSKFKFAMSDSNGNFRIGGLSAGTYTIEIRVPWDQQNYMGLYAPAAITNFVVNANGSVTYNSATTTAGSLPVNLGNIAYRLAAKTITGKVTKTDGSAVANVKIRAFKDMGMGMAQASTNSSGDYTLKLGGGRWMLMPEIDYAGNFDDNNDNNVSADWVYCGRPKMLNFADNAESESSSSNNFEVKTSNATITGKVTFPNGSPASGSASVNVFSKDGCGSYGYINWNDGTFNAQVPPGTYSVEVNTWSENYSSPPAVNVTVASGTTDIGTLALVEKTSTISGRLWADSNGNGTYDTGEGLGNVRVEASKMAKKFDEFATGGSGGGFGGGEWASTISSNSTGAKGNFSLKVTKGSWMVNVMADMGMMGGGYSSSSTNYIYTGTPVQINISSDNQTSLNNNFKLSIADATISGRIISSDTSDAITGIWGYAFAEPSGTYGQGPMMGAGMGSPINNGIFTIKVPAGSYKVGVDFPPASSGYTPSSTTAVTAISGDTVTVDVPVVPNNATIRVNFKDSGGSLITDLAYAEVFLENGAGGHQWKMLSSSDLSNGYTDISTSSGVWRVGYHIDPTQAGYMSSANSVSKVTALANQTVQANVALTPANSTISGTVTNPSGAPLSGVWVSTDNRKTTGFTPGMGNMFMQGGVTNSDGNYSIRVPSGTYKIEAHFPPSAVVGGQTVNYINPESKEVTVAANSTSTTNFTFGQSDATITGTITLNGVKQGAFVTTYSNKGGYNETNSTNGDYSIAVTKSDTWYVRAMYETGNNFYLSSVQEVAMGSSSSKTQDLALSTASFTIPDAVSSTFNCANAKKIELSNGTVLSIPASAIVPSSVSSCDSSSSSSNITITITPTAQMSTQNKSIPIGIGYEIEARDTNGSAISSNFNSNVTITLPYTADQISQSLGGTVNESLLNNGYWDTSTSVWKSVENQVLDTENNTLTISTNHFTLFGVIAATTPSSTSSSSTSNSETNTFGQDSTELNGAPYFLINTVNGVPYNSSKYYYPFNFQNHIVVKGEGNPERKVVAMVDNGRKTDTVYVNANSGWEYVLYNPENREYKLDMYSESEDGIKSKVKSFYITSVLGASTTKVRETAFDNLGDTYQDCGQTYQVEIGDSLWTIAHKKLGDGGVYPILLDFNKSLTKNSVLNVGNKLNIPCKQSKIGIIEPEKQETTTKEQSNIKESLQNLEDSKIIDDDKISQDKQGLIFYSVLIIFIFISGLVAYLFFFKRV